MKTHWMNSTSRIAYSPDDGGSAAATTGADSVAGATGADSVAGATGADSTAAATGQDSVDAGGGDDKLDLSKKEDTLLADPKDKDEKKPDPVVVPEVYEFKAPEGQGDLDPELVAAATPIFKELGLDNAGGQKLIDLYAGQVLPGVAQAVQAQTLDLLGLSDIGKWTDMVKADKEIGGANLEQTLAMAAKGRDTYATPALRALLETSRMGNHPEIVRFFAAVGKTVGDDPVIKGDGHGTDVRNGSLYGPEFDPKT